LVKVTAARPTVAIGPIANATDDDTNAAVVIITDSAEPEQCLKHATRRLSAATAAALTTGISATGAFGELAF